IRASKKLSPRLRPKKLFPNNAWFSLGSPAPPYARVLSGLHQFLFNSVGIREQAIQSGTASFRITSHRILRITSTEARNGSSMARRSLGEDRTVGSQRSPNR